MEACPRRRLPSPDQQPSVCSHPRLWDPAFLHDLHHHLLRHAWDVVSGLERGLAHGGHLPLRVHGAGRRILCWAHVQDHEGEGVEEGGFPHGHALSWHNIRAGDLCQLLHLGQALLRRHSLRHADLNGGNVVWDLAAARLHRILFRISQTPL